MKFRGQNRASHRFTWKPEREKSRCKRDGSI